MKKTLNVFLHYSTSKYNFGELAIYQCDLSKSEGADCVMVKPLQIEVDMPDDFDPRPQRIDALREKQKKAAAAFLAFTTETLRQINELQALEMTA